MKPSTGDTHAALVSDRSWVVRDDGEGTITRALGDEIEVARRLLEWAEVITGEHDFERWENEFAQWRRSCGRLLRRSFHSEAAEEFDGRTRIRKGLAAEWRVGRRQRIKATEDMIQHLVTLRTSVARRVEPADA